MSCKWRVANSGTQRHVTQSIKTDNHECSAKATHPTSQVLGNSAWAERTIRHDQCCDHGLANFPSQRRDESELECSVHDEKSMCVESSRQRQDQGLLVEKIRRSPQLSPRTVNAVNADPTRRLPQWFVTVVRNRQNNLNSQEQVRRQGHRLSTASMLHTSYWR